MAVLSNEAVSPKFAEECSDFQQRSIAEESDLSCSGRSSYADSSSFLSNVENARAIHLPACRSWHPLNYRIGSRTQYLILEAGQMMGYIRTKALTMTPGIVTERCHIPCALAKYHD